MDKVDVAHFNFLYILAIEPLNLEYMNLPFGLLAFTSILFMSCISPNKESVPEHPMVSTVMTADQQKKLTPDAVIHLLKAGNNQYVNNTLTSRDYPSQVSKSTKGQYPSAVVLSCIDSRVPVETIFDQGVGDLFVARVAGNFVNEDILGSMEYACKVAGSKLVLVMGHEHCGAVKAAIDDVKLGNITPMLSKIRPVLEGFTSEGEMSSSNPELVHQVCEANVKRTIEQIRLKSPILAEMEVNKEIKLVGGIYDLDTGKVNFLSSSP